MLSCDLQVGNYVQANHKVKSLRLKTQEQSVLSSPDNRMSRIQEVLPEHIVTFQSNHIAISK